MTNNASSTLPDWLDAYWPGQIRIKTQEDYKKDISVAFPSGSDTAGEEAIISSIFIARVKHVPTDDLIATALELRPDAEPLLRLWKDMWEASIALPNEVSHPNPRKKHEDWLAGRLPRESEALEAIDYCNAANARLWHEFYQDLDGYRDNRLHIIDDASTFLSLRHAQPGFAYLHVGEETFVLTGHAGDGAPLLDRMRTPPFVERGHFASMPRAKERMRDVLNNGYWHFAPYLDASRRHQIYSSNHKGTVAILAAMARAGHEKAFVKGAKPKDGTWTVDLRGVETLSDVAGRYYHALFPCDPSQKVLIQEHLPFTHEQRFFVFNGRVVASVCSDRNFCAIDRRKGHRLDDRVSVILKPSGESGDYDRGHTTHAVDRSMSASFARLVRKFVREMRDIGVREFVVDVGMTSRGPAIIETNDFVLSGPYCLDYDILARAAKRDFERLAKKVRLALLEEAPRQGLSEAETDGILALRIPTPDMFSKSFSEPDRVFSIMADSIGRPGIRKEELSEKVMRPWGDNDEAKTLDAMGRGAALLRLPARERQRDQFHPCTGYHTIVLTPEGRLIANFSGWTKWDGTPVTSRHADVHIMLDHCGTHCSTRLPNSIVVTLSPVEDRALLRVSVESEGEEFLSFEIPLPDGVLVVWDEPAQKSDTLAQLTDTLDDLLAGDLLKDDLEAMV